jgi:uncharacterized protein
MLPPLHCALLLAGGAASGLINVVAGGGSFLTMAMLMQGGLNVNVANGTIRPGILVQNLLALAIFREHSLIKRAEVFKWTIPVVLGAVLGSKIASDAPPEVFKQWMIPLVLIGCWPLAQEFLPRPEVKNDGSPPVARRGAWLYFFLAGMYGGLIQAGVGFLLLGAARHAGYDLRRGNALKVALTFMLGVPSMLVFQGAGQIHLEAALWLSGGTLIGAYYGAKWVALKSMKWLKGFLLMGLLIFVLHLAFGG